MYLELNFNYLANFQFYTATCLRIIQEVDEKQGFVKKEFQIKPENNCSEV